MRRPGRGGNAAGANFLPLPSVQTAGTSGLRSAGRAVDALSSIREPTTKDVPEEVEGDDDGDREEAEPNRVLGRRLAILTLPQLVHCNLQCDERTHQDVGHLEVP